jgi:Putative Flp pilus-assembly TadE/G-like
MKEKRNRGQVLVLVALAIFALLGFAALGIDVGFMYSVRHELQRSADSGALAGASSFTTGDWNDTSMSSTSPRGIAYARAKEFASKDEVVQTTLNPDSEVDVTFPQYDRIRVDTSRKVDLFFARILGMSNRTITAYAIAEAAVVNQKLPCVKPWGIPYPWKDDDGDKQYDPTETVYNMCPDGTFAPDNNSFCQGTPMVLKVGTPSGKEDQPNVPSLQQEPGHFFALDFGSGAKTYEEMIKGGCPDDSIVSVGDSIPLEPGNMVGPTYQGVTSDGDSLVSLDPTSRWDTSTNLPTSDKYNGDNWLNSPRVVRIPIYDPRDAISNGKTDMVVAALAGFWVEGCEKQGQQGTVYGRFIPMSAFGEFSGPAGPTTGPALKSIRLVE